MGFRVDISDNDDRVLKRLAHNPYSVFPAPYNGYLLFLIGGSDKTALDWLAANILQLDSLTGGDIAFAVFTKRFDFKLRTGWMHRAESPAPHNVGEFDPMTLSGGRDAVSSLVRKGRCGFVINDDTIAAVTYAADDVARHLKVFDSMPCVLAIDGLPFDQSAEIIRLTDDVLPHFIHLLRTALATFTAEATYADMNAEIRYALSIQQKLRGIEQRERSIRNQLDSLRKQLRALKGVDDPTYLRTDALEDRIRRARAAILTGSLKGFRAAFAASHPGEVESASALIGEYANRTLEGLRESTTRHICLVQTMNTLAHYVASSSWPLSDSWVQRYKHVYDTYASKLLSQNLSCDPQSPKHCTDIISLLDAARKEALESIDQCMPSVAGIRAGVQNQLCLQNKDAIRLCESNIAEKEAELAEMAITIQSEQAEAEALLADWTRRQAKNLPSFTAHVRAAKREHRLQRYGSTGRGIVFDCISNLFKPEFLFKISQWVAGII